MITVTVRAAKKLKEIFEKQPNSENKVLRVAQGGFG